MQQSPILDPSEMPSKRSKLACSYCERTFAKAEHLIVSTHPGLHTGVQITDCIYLSDTSEAVRPQPHLADGMY